MIKEFLFSKSWLLFHGVLFWVLAWIAFSFAIYPLMFMKLSLQCIGITTLGEISSFSWLGRAWRLPEVRPFLWTDFLILKTSRSSKDLITNLLFFSSSVCFSLYLNLISKPKRLRTDGSNSSYTSSWLI